MQPDRRTVCCPVQLQQLEHAGRLRGLETDQQEEAGDQDVHPGHSEDHGLQVREVGEVGGGERWWIQDLKEGASG